MFLNNFFKKIILKEKYTSNSYILYLRKQGLKIGNDCTIYVPSKTFIDVQYPWMISIGNHVRITEGVKILTHDYSWSTLKLLSQENEKIGAILGASGEVVIGDNVFIGMNSIILRNVHIGNNVIIGAGSVVSKDCADNGVYAGNPAKYIMSIEDFYQKRKDKQLEEASLLAYKYWQKYQFKPKEDVFHEYFMLFTSFDEIEKNRTFKNKTMLGGNAEESIAYLKHNPPLFKNYDEFWAYCIKKWDIDAQQ